MSATSRRKGARAEVDVVNYLRSQGWPDTRRYLAGDGRQPGDVDWHPLVCLEVKDRKDSSWPSWCKQARAEARAGMVPAVVRKMAGTKDVARWTVRVHAATWLEVMRDEDGTKTDPDLWWPMTMAMLVADVRAIDEGAA